MKVGQQRSEAKHEVHHAAAKEPADPGAGQTADDRSNGRRGLGVGLGGRIGGARHLVRPERQPLHRTPGADQRHGRQQRRHQRPFQQGRTEDFRQRTRRLGRRFDRGVPLLRLRHKQAHDEGQGRGGRAHDGNPAPRIDRDLEEHAEDCDQGEADVGRGADDAGHERPMFFRPDLHDERHAERPFTAHAQRPNEAEETEVPRFARKIN